MPKVSIVTINYNDAAGLRATASSIVSQTRFDEIEWIVIDGGSTDGSVNVIHEFADKISYWVSEKDQGIYNAMNKGLAQAHGEYLLFRNSGDLMSTPDTVEKFIQHPAYGKYDHCWGITELMQNHQWIRDIYPVVEFKLTDFFGGLAYHPSAFIRRERFSYETYDESLKIASDTKFLFKDIVLRNASYTPLDFPVAKFDNSGISATNQELSMQEVYSYLEEYLPAFIFRECKTACNYPSGPKRILSLLTRMNAWEHRILAHIAYLLYIPRYVTKKARSFLKKNFTRRK
ncbi:MAG: glycosyltransferase [Akkermansia sp.]|nr:glycosyltransferase [Akkermansia sp.]